MFGNALGEEHVLRSICLAEGGESNWAVYQEFYDL
jgi:predicted secreted protein